MTGWSRADSTQPQWLILKRTVPGYAPARSCKVSAGRSSSSSSKLQFTARVYYPGRRVRIAYNYNLALHPTLMATVKRFEVALASVHPEMFDFYQGLRPSDEIALIHLQVEKGA
jgi:hypothetical protein